MKKDFRQSMTWLHTWTGLIFCWVMYFMFVTGTLGYFDHEIDQWMKPEYSQAATKTLAQEMRTGVKYLQTAHSEADNWYIGSTGSRNYKQLKAFWSYSDKERGRGAIDVDNETALALAARDTGGGQRLYKMHYVLHYLPRDAAYTFVGIVTMIMFIGLITGVIAHRKIFKDFFSFRPEKGKAAILDMHNLSSITSLPFQFMITYSGLIFVISSIVPFVKLGVYDFDKEVMKQFRRDNINIQASGNYAPLTDIGILAEQVEQSWGKNSVYFAQVKYPNDENAYIVFTGLLPDATSSRKKMMFHGVTGEPMIYPSNETSTVARVSSTFINLHEGNFAGLPMRWLFFFSGIMGCIMIGSGAIQYAEKRRRKNQRQSRAQRCIDVVNLGTIVGLPIAIVGYFMANRLLPVDMSDRANWEVHCMFITWCLTFIYAGIRPHSRSWSEMLWFATAALVSLPMINSLTTNRGMLNAFASQDWDRFYFDLSCLLFAAIAAFAAKKLQNKRQVRTKAPRQIYQNKQLKV